MDVLIELCVFNLKSANGRIAQLIHKQKYSTNNYLAVEILISDKFLVMNFQRDKDVKLPGKMYDCLIQVRSTSNFELIYSVKELEGIKPVFFCRSKTSLQTCGWRTQVSMNLFSVPLILI